MNCPKDDHVLRAVRIGDVRVDRCGECGGTWYDRNELRLLKDRESHQDYRWIDVDLWRDLHKFGARRATRYACPRDGTRLITVQYGDSGIHADLCERCGGIWLDEGEYARIIQRLEKSVEASSLDDYLKDVRDELREVIRGPEGPVSELRDLAKVVYLLELRFAIEHPAIRAFLEALPKV